MCSIDESNDDVIGMKTKPTPSKVCMKCGDEAVLVIRMNDPFCRNCFLAYVVHKFRAAIGKSKLIRDGERVLVGVSGGPSSCCLLQLIKDGLGKDAYKKLRFKPSLVYVDEGAAIGQSPEQRLQMYRLMKCHMLESGFPGYITSLQTERPLMREYENQPHLIPANQNTTFHTVTNDYTPDKLVLSEESEDELRDLIGSVKSFTEKENLIKMLRYHVLLRLARETGHSKVMIGDTASRLAVKLLTGIAQGRGGHIPFDTGFSDTRNPDITFVRPLKDFTVKEVAMFNRYSDLTPMFTPTVTTKTEPGSSIEHLTEEFVYGLQVDYLATVSNITRTGEKLDHIEKDEGKETEQCVLCLAPLDTDTRLCSALSALEFSHSLSQRPLEDSSVDTGGRACPLSHDEILSGLCYGCRITISDTGFTKLPALVSSDLVKRKNRIQMKEEIADCLLPDTS